MVIAVLLTGIQYAHAGMDPPNPFIGLNKFMILVPTGVFSQGSNYINLSVNSPSRTLHRLLLRDKI